MVGLVIRMRLERGCWRMEWRKREGEKGCLELRDHEVYWRGLLFKSETRRGLERGWTVTAGSAVGRRRL